MRTFIALVPPEEITVRLSAIGGEIRRIAPRLRIESPDKLHFTLEFLGEKSEAWIDQCRGALTSGLGTAGVVTVAITRIGFFPGRKNPRIIWAGTSPEENASLCRLASRVRTVCTGLGHIPDPKPFHPHITLTRVKTPLPNGLIEQIADLGMEPVTFSCREIGLIKSTLTPHGSRYEQIGTIALNVAQ